MKKIITICAALLMTASVFAQSPEKMSYQAAVRDGNNALVTSTAVGMQISILQGSASGTAVYVETQTPTTNANGLVSLEIGAGTVLSGDFTTIDWTAGPYFIKTETDPTGGTTYTITGTSQLMSVPYALHAKTADSITGTVNYTETDPVFGSSVASGITGTDTTNWNNKLDSYTETDPIFGASVASGITGTDTTNWNNKLDSYTENDPVFGSSVASGITGTDTTNWNNKLDSYTETDPVFGSSVASGITGTDTTNWNNKQEPLVAGTNITIVGNTISATVAGGSGITISSVSASGDTLYLSNGQTFVAGGNSGGTGNLVLPTIITTAVSGITSNSATFGGSISNANGNQIMERGIVYSTSPNPTLGSNKIMIGSGIGTFDTISGLGYQDNHLLNSNTTYYVRAYAVTENNICAYGNEVSFTTISVGQAGPGGGIVFFDKGNSTGGWQYLETATSDQSTGITWGCGGTSFPGIPGTSIPGTQNTVGSGEANTALIVAGCNQASFAAKLCNDLVLGGQSDWFLPSRDELNLMYKNLHLNNQGNFSLAYYWSSTEHNASHAISFFFNGGTATNHYKTNPYSVRAVRAF